MIQSWEKLVTDGWTDRHMDGQTDRQIKLTPNESDKVVVNL